MSGASFTVSDYPLWLDGGTYEANALRTFGTAATFFRTGTAQVASGVTPGGGNLQVTAPGGMNITAGTGFCVVASSAGSTFGGYQFGLTAAHTLAIATSDPTNPRIDLVCMTVIDNGNSTSSGIVQVVTGVAASSPSAPALPANSLELATIAVAANATSITTGNITDQRVFTAATGGVIPVPTVAQSPAGYSGCYVHDRNTNRLWHNSATGPVQAQILWAPVYVTAVADKVNTGSETTVLTASVTTDGNTDIMITARWPGIYVTAAGTAGMTAEMNLYIGSNQIANMNIENRQDDGTTRGGATLIHHTSSGLGDTPTAGTHTIKWTFIQLYGLSSNVRIQGGTNRPISLRVEPVLL